MSYIPMQIPITYLLAPSNNGNIEIVRVRVDGEEYEMCEKSSHNMWSNKKTGLWGRGYMNIPCDERRVERAGRLGEMAFCKITNSCIDLDYKEGGDQQDTFFRGKSVNIKTAFKLYGYVMVRCEDQYRRPIILHEDVWVFSYIRDNREEQIATLDFLGCLLKPDLIKKPKVKKQEWTNYECPYLELHPMRRLLTIPSDSYSNRT